MVMFPQYDRHGLRWMLLAKPSGIDAREIERVMIKKGAVGMVVIDGRVEEVTRGNVTKKTRLVSVMLCLDS